MPRILPGLIGLVLAFGSVASAQEAPPLARYVPMDNLAILVENDGFASNSKAWKATSTYKMLNETTLGVMLEDLTSQLIARAMRGAPGQTPTPKEIVGLTEHLLGEGFVVGYCGSLDPPQPQAVVLVIRNAAKNPTFKKVVAMIPPLNEPSAQKVDAPGGRKVWQLEAAPVRWWYEKEDAVFSFAAPGAPDPVIDALEGKAPSAVKSPIRAALMKGEAGEVPVSRLFVDLKALPPLPPAAAEFGLDTITRFEAKLGFLDKGIVSTFGVQAPRPRAGILGLFDQPSIGDLAKIVYPSGVTDSTIVSIDLAKTSDVILALMKQRDPDSASKATAFAEQFKARTGLSLRDDVAAKIGPRMAMLAPTGGSGFGNIYGMWFSPPETGMVAELKDAKGFVATLDKLIEFSNRELKNAGGMAPPLPGSPPSKPGTSYAEFRKLAGAEKGYVLTIPPAALPLPATFRPTVIVDPAKNLVAFGTSLVAARQALGSLVLNGGSKTPRDPSAVAVAVTDPSGSLPGVLVNLPSLIQMIGFAASQPNPRMPRQAGPPLRVEIDPDAIPTVQSLKPFLFPSKYTMSVDNASIKFTAFQAFPLYVPEMKGGMEAPVLVALLLPAVQAAREAARRSQCVNNMKQMGLAMHNFHATHDAFPSTAILDKDGKPLLSWRVSILPFIEQQELYNKFKLDEPWDSPNNKPLIAEMPNVFACPSNNPPLAPGMTLYQVFTGNGALLDIDQATSLNQVTDGTSNTLMVVEATNPVIWTKPDDIKFAGPGQALPLAKMGVGSKHPGGFNALLADGSVRFIKLTINPNVLEALITKAGGEVIAADAY